MHAMRVVAVCGKFGRLDATADGATGAAHTRKTVSPLALPGRHMSVAPSAKMTASAPSSAPSSGNDLSTAELEEMLSELVEKYGSPKFQALLVSERQRHKIDSPVWMAPHQC